MSVQGWDMTMLCVQRLVSGLPMIDAASCTFLAVLFKCCNARCRIAPSARIANGRRVSFGPKQRWTICFGIAEDLKTSAVRFWVRFHRSFLLGYRLCKDDWDGLRARPMMC